MNEEVPLFTERCERKTELTDISAQSETRRTVG